MEHSQVVPKGPKEENAILGNQRKPTAKSIQPNILDVDAVDLDLSALELNHPEQDL